MKQFLEVVLLKWLVPMKGTDSAYAKESEQNGLLVKFPESAVLFPKIA